jgi:hypothetical protein
MMLMRDAPWLWMLSLAALSVTAGLAVKAMLRAPDLRTQTPAAVVRRIGPASIQLPPRPDGPASESEFSIELDDEYLRRSPEEWERLLQHPAASKRAYAVSILARQGGRFVPLCLWALDDHHTSVRIAGLKALGAMGTAAATAVDSVIDASRYDPSPEVRAHAINTLGLIGPGNDRAVRTLRTFLESPDPSIRQSARLALRRIAGSPH